MNYFSVNLKFLRKQNGYTQADFANKIGVNRPIIGSYEEGRAEPKFETLQNISHFFQIAIDDLLEKRLDQEVTTLKKDIEGNNIRVLPIVVNSENEELIPLVPIKASAGYLSNYSDPEFIERLPNFSLPLKELSQGTFRAFQIKGDSMLPIQPGSYVLTEHLENWNWIKDGECYVIVSKDEGVVYKRVYKQFEKQKHLELKSDNKNYEPFHIPIENVVEVWKAKGYLTFDLPDSSEKETLSVNEISTMLLELQSKVEKLK